MAAQRTDWGSVVAGLLFLGLAVAFALHGTGDWSFNVWWVLPVLAAGLCLAAVARHLSRRASRYQGPEGGGRALGRGEGTASGISSGPASDL